MCSGLFADYRAYIALGSAVIFVLMGILPVSQVFGAIDWNVLMMIAGTAEACGTFYRIQNAGSAGRHHS